MRMLFKENLQPTTMRNMRLRSFKITRFTRKNLKLATFQAFIIWYYGKANLKKKILENHLLPSNTFGR